MVEGHVVDDVADARRCHGQGGRNRGELGVTEWYRGAPGSPLGLVGLAGLFRQGKEAS